MHHINEEYRNDLVNGTLNICACAVEKNKLWKHWTSKKSQQVTAAYRPHSNGLDQECMCPWLDKRTNQTLKM